MCGIVGLLLGRRRGFEDASSLIHSMMQSVSHRGPDGRGAVLMSPGLTVTADLEPGTQVVQTRHARLALGHQRLAIIDLSEQASQPMWASSAPVAIVFNGEVYNYIELRKELENNYEFKTRSDTEVLLAAYLAWNEGLLPRLDGMFAFAIWDGRDETLFCARDPLGIKPFYYSCDQQSFFFGSEPRAVLKGLGTAGHIDVAGLADFLLFGISDHDEGTFFREVRQLPPASWARVKSDGKIDGPHDYWNTPGAFSGDPQMFPMLLRDRLTASVARQLRSDVRVGSCLSGGLDSGAIVVSAGQVMGEAAEQYTALTLRNPGFAGDESDQARVTARIAGLRWLPVDADLPNLAKDVEGMARAMGEPFSSLSMLAQFLIMRQARGEGLKVMLDGQGGDEVYVGYSRVAQRILFDHVRDGKLLSFGREVLGLWKNASLPPWRSLPGVAFFRSPRLALLRNRRRLSRLVPEDILRAARLEVAEELYSPATLQGAQVAELRRYCLPRLLRYEDRNSMAFGVEARVPHLGAPVLELALGAPTEWQVRHGWTKYGLRKAMDGLLPDDVVWNRVKRGFEVPQARWIRALNGFLRERIGSLPAEVPLNCGQLNASLAGDQCDAPWLWRCISVGLWISLTGVRA